VLVGLVWALYNVGLIGLLSFGPAFMIAGGSDPIAAQATVSAVSWLILPTLAVAGWTTVRTGRPDLILVLGVVATAALILLLPFAGGSVLLFGAIGFMFGIPGPVIVTLPVRAVSAARRGIGFGIFYALNYSGMAVTGPIGGWLLDTTGSATAPIWFSGLALLTSLVPLGMFHLMSRRTPVAN